MVHLDWSLCKLVVNVGVQKNRRYMFLQEKLDSVHSKMTDDPSSSRFAWGD